MRFFFALVLMTQIVVDARASVLLEMSGGSYFGAFKRDVGFSAPKFEWIPAQLEVDKVVEVRVGERLVKATAYLDKYPVIIKIDSPMVFSGKAPLFGKLSISVPAGEHVASFSLKHPVYGPLYSLMGFNKLGYGVLIDGSGNVFPQFIAVNDKYPDSLIASKIETISEGNIKVGAGVKERKVSGIFDAHLKSIDGGVVTISTHCTNEEGVIRNKNEYQFSDSALSFEVFNFKYELLGVSNDRIKIRGVSGVTSVGC